jgi:cellulose synthase/poly-beta-1,6-N-acetylglucosamine synthase-like glycosyltransferase
MSLAAALVFALSGVILTIPLVVLFLECALAALPKPKSSAPGEGEPRTVVMIPAHDEELVLGQTLQALIPRTPGWARILVVADNCSDATAQIARQSGVEVIERSDPERIGKGHALRFGLAHLAPNPPEVVVIIDADCVVSRDGIARLAQMAHARKRPVQADNLVELSPAAAVRSRISAFAFAVRNRVRPRGLARIGMPCQLMGTGMAMPFGQLEQVSVAGSHLVEDMLLGLDLAKRGFAPLYTDEAHVVSVQPNDAATALQQRRRWEQGHLRTALGKGPKLLWQGLRSGSPSVIAMALDLLVPPLTLVVVLVGAYAIACAAAWALLGLRWPLAWAAVDAALLLAAVSVGWLLEGRSILRLRHLLLVPLYVLWKLPLYLALVVRRGQKSWQRTDRSDGTAPPATGTRPQAPG